MARAVFVDRDGVLNRTDVRGGKPFAPLHVQDFEILTGTKEALDLVRAAGFLIIVVTNQPDVGSGKIVLTEVEAMHRKLFSTLPIDDLEVCYATKEQGSLRRKPNPGMLLDAARKWQIDLGHSFMVGDRWSDVEAGKAAGCRTILLQYGYAEKLTVEPDFEATTLLEASHIILREVKNSIS